MVDTIKFSQMTDGGDIDNNKKTPGLSGGANVLFNNPWTFLPPGTTAQRPTPSAEVNYRLRFNTEDQLYEYYDAVLGAWTQLQESMFTAGPFLIYQADPAIPDGQNLGALSDGILKQSIAAGVATLGIAVQGTDYYAPGDNATFSGLTMTGNIDMGGFRARNAADPLLAQDYATKNYVDQNSLNGTSVYAASAGSLGVVIQSGSGIGATLTNGGVQAVFALDGVNPPIGTNVLIKNTGTGMTAANEGIYTVTDPGSISTDWVLTRAVSFDTAPEINTTGLIIVQNGSTLSGTIWYNTNTIVVVDTTNFNFVEYGGQFALKGANSDITSMTGLTGVLQAPTAINDANGNTMLHFTAVPSAVNYVEISNNSTGNASAIGAAGLDSSIPLITSNKNAYTSILDSTGTIGGQIRFYNAAHTHFTGLKVATGQATDVTFTLPATDGLANYVLKTDGAGNLTFANVTGLSTLPTVQKFTSGSGTYTKPAGCTYIRVVGVAGGGGGGGSGTTNGAGQTAGGDTSFGSVLTLAGGSAGSAGVFGGNGGAGGVVTTNTASPGGLAVAGGNGQGGNYGPSNLGVLNTPGGMGGSSMLGGAGASYFSTGVAGQTNTGGGGAGGACVGAGPGGGGGGAGAGCDILITNPDATYAYAVGVGGTAGAAGTSGAVGYAGGSGLITVYEFYN